MSFTSVSGVNYGTKRKSLKTTPRNVFENHLEVYPNMFFKLKFKTFKQVRIRNISPCHHACSMLCFAQFLNVLVASKPNGLSTYTVRLGEICEGGVWGQFVPKSRPPHQLEQEIDQPQHLKISAVHPVFQSSPNKRH